MEPIRILAFGGSLRRESLNHRLVQIAAASATAAGATVTLTRLSDHPMPIYDGDIEQEQGFPPGAVSFKRLLSEHDALLIASPEYNSSYPGGLKNAIDWASRAAPGEAPLAAFRGKVVGIMAASPGPLGGIRMLPVLRQLLSSIGMLVVPEQAAVGGAGSLFDSTGILTDPRLHGMVQAVGTAVARLAAQRRT
jgi:chromate reductase, NAD(P)H dehydrogenase (quinone)